MKPLFRPIFYLLIGVWLCACEAEPDRTADTATATATATVQNESADFLLYEGLKAQFTLELPPDWHVQLKDQAGPHSAVRFFAEDISNIQLKELIKIAEQINSGELATFVVDRNPAMSDTSCDGFSEKAREEKLRMVTSANPLPLVQNSTLLEPALVEPIALGGCQGLMILARYQDQAKEGFGEFGILQYTVSDRQTTYDFRLTSLKEYFEKNRPLFEKVISTLKITNREPIG